LQVQRVIAAALQSSAEKRWIDCPTD